MIDQFQDAIGQCQSIEDVARLLREAIAPFGFTACAAGAFLPADRGPEPRFFFQDWPQDWLALYMERNFVAVDYGVAEARRRLEPFSWNEAKAERDLSRAEQALWDEANRWGWLDGFSVPIHGPGGYFAIVTMARESEGVEASLRLHLRMLSLLTHDRCRELAGLGSVSDLAEPLTARELECMRWVAAGKTDPEISEILEIGAATTKTHIEGARRKLGATTRSQAVARLVFAGLS